MEPVGQHRGSTARESAARPSCRSRNAPRCRRDRRSTAATRIPAIDGRRYVVGCTASDVAARGLRLVDRPFRRAKRADASSNVERHGVGSAQIPIGRRDGPRFSATRFLRRLTIMRGGCKYSCLASQKPHYCATMKKWLCQSLLLHVDFKHHVAIIARSNLSPLPGGFCC